jgi:HD superfamily phosphohydrolase
LAGQEKTSQEERKIRKKLNISKKIYDNVHGYIDITEEERLLIDSPVFQRLRRISHLGLADFVYPGATQSRFSHSIGSLHVMTKIALALIDDEIINYEDLSELRVAALLHDVGHYPFSHVLEGTMKNIDGEAAKHEQLGVFLAKETSLKDSIGRICNPEDIVAILEGKFREPPLFQYLTSSSLDVDKMDYLQRDSVHTGVAYGAFDINRLLSCLEPDGAEEPTKLVVTKKGQQAIEDFLLGRYHMFQSVYHHKSVVAFELMLDRVADTLIRKGSLENLTRIKEETRKDERWFGDYDDAYVWQVFKAHKTGESVSNHLVRRLLSRDSLKMADEKLQLTESLSPEMLQDLAKDALPSWLGKQSGVEPEWIFYKQQPRVTFLEEEPDRTVYIQTQDGVKPIIEEPTSIIKKLWESRFKADRIYTRDNSAKDKIETFLKKYKSKQK